MDARVAALCTLLTLVGGAHAVTVNITGFERNPPSEVSVKGTSVSYTGNAGELSALLLQGATVARVQGLRHILAPGVLPTSFAAYCGELTQLIDFGFPHDYTRMDAAAQYGAAKASDLGRLFSAAPSFVVDASTSAAFQAALWEIIYEPGSSYDLASGSFTGVPQNAGDLYTAAALSAINGVLMNLASHAAQYKVDVLTNDQFQDILVATAVAPAVPEPSTSILLALGLLGVACAARRKAG
jgi:hypothetical protein